MILNISSTLSLDSNLEPFKTEGLRLGAFGSSGSGKSYVVGILIEQFLDQNGTVVIYAPRSEYYTLKERYDIVQIGGLNKDIDFIARSPASYAKMVTARGISMSFQTGEVEDEAKLVDFVSNFLKYIMQYNEIERRPILVVIEECQEYAPRSSAGHIAPPWVYNRMVKRFTDIFTQGRKLNISAIAVSQRPQEINYTIRQLANVTMYGKFQSQDIAYIQKECLDIYKKRGLDIDGSKMLDVKSGEFLTISSGTAQTVYVDIKRKTKHGAETPPLDYVRPISEDKKASVNELVLILQNDLKKEREEEDIIGKMEKEVDKLEKENKELSEKVKLGQNLRELFKEGSSQEEYLKAKERIDFIEIDLVKTKENLRATESNLAHANKENIELHKTLGELAEEAQLIDNLKKNFGGMIWSSVRDKIGEFVDSAISAKTSMLASPPIDLKDGKQEQSSVPIDLAKVRTQVNIKKAMTKITASTDTAEGLLIYLAVKDNFFDMPKSAPLCATEIRMRGKQIGDSSIYATLDRLVEAGLLLKSRSAKSVVYQRPKDWKDWVTVNET